MRAGRTQRVEDFWSEKLRKGFTKGIELELNLVKESSERGERKGHSGHKNMGSK